MVPGHIFREYDIRGLHESELTDPVAESVGRAFATLIREGRAAGAGGARVALGRDVRPSSERLERAVEQGIVSAGLAVQKTGVVPTPALYYAVAARRLDGGLQVTGSHNPPEFNGFKMTRAKLPLFGAEIQEMRERIAGGRLRSAPGGTVTPQVFERMGHRVTALYPELDGTFPNHLAVPTVPALLVDLIAAVKQNGAELGIGFDGDADRIGAVDAGGRIVFGDQLLALFARDVLTRVPGGEIIFDVKCSQALSEDIAAHGGKPSMWKTGHSLLKSRLQETGAPLAGEMSGHICFQEGYFGYDDALFAAGRLLRYLSAGNQSLAEMLDSLPRYVSTPETRLPCPEEKKFAVVEELRKEFAARYRVIDIDGVRVEFGDGWGLARASNTQPVIVVRFEAKTQARLEEIRETFMAPLRRLVVDDRAVAH